VGVSVGVDVGSIEISPEMETNGIAMDEVFVAVARLRTGAWGLV